MPKSLNDTIREEFKNKLTQAKFIELCQKSNLNENVLTNSLESLLPDQDWKREDDDKKLAKMNANKLINNINSQLSNEN